MADDGRIGAVTPAERVALFAIGAIILGEAAYLLAVYFQLG